MIADAKRFPTHAKEEWFIKVVADIFGEWHAFWRDVVHIPRILILVIIVVVLALLLLQIQRRH
jgi:hypothetical protein